MLTQRRAAGAVLVISLGVFLLSAGAMAARIHRFNREQLGAKPVFAPIMDPAFSFADRPVSFVTDDSGAVPVVTLAYGSSTLALPQTIPGGVEALPDLRRHEDWLRVFRFALTKGQSVDEVGASIRDGSIQDRLAVVVRIPPGGVDPDTWGQVWAKRWRFDLHELMPDGTIASERLGYPTRKRGEPPKPGELVEGSWQYHAALLTMPANRGPAPRFGNDAVGEFGWTFAGVGLSAVAGAVAAGFLLAPRRARPA
jgi:hypothetical protein